MNDPYVIAEIGVNYYDISDRWGISLLDAAKFMIVECRDSGSNAVKFQSYKANKIVSKNSPAYWDTSFETTTSQYELFKKYDSFGEKDYKALSEFCNLIGIDFMCTPFDLESVDYLDALVKCHKVSSSDITNYPLLKKVGRTGKKVILSTGASTMTEIAGAIDVIESTGNTDIVLLHCVLNYPTLNENANLGMIEKLKEFGKEVGYSDHTMPDDSMLILTTAVMMGSTWIEKHFTTDKTLPGNDHYHSMDANDLEQFISNLKLIQSISKEGDLGTQDLARTNARRSVYTRHSLKGGSILSSEDLICKRPATGICARKFEDILGMTLVADMEEDTVLTEDLLK
tara:strand:- start:3137 stop:4162 length:1026 start_codon:yes stop_codon:yes gene_type:complete